VLGGVSQFIVFVLLNLGFRGIETTTDLGWQLVKKDCPFLTVCASHESFREHAGKPIKRRQAMKQLIELCASKLIDIRPFRSEPRAVKRRPKNHPLLNAPRHEYIEVCHRSRYRLNA